MKRFKRRSPKTKSFRGLTQGRLRFERLEARDLFAVDFLGDIGTTELNLRPTEVLEVGGTVFFTGNDGTHGEELWKTDGTAAGTVLVKDINPGAAGSRFNSQWFTNVNGSLYFTATDGVHGLELWTSDGTEVGTRMVADILPGSADSAPSRLTNLNGTLLFTPTVTGLGYDSLWISDGTELGTQLLVASVSHGPPTVVGGTAYFAARDDVHGRELWKTDGTVAGTGIFKDLNPGSESSDPSYLSNVAGRLYFRASSAATGRELWTSDGTVAGTNLVKDVLVGTGSSAPRDTVEVNGTAYFTANDGVNGNELWKSDGTAAGTQLVANIRPGSANSYPSNLVNVGGTLYFTANDGISGIELWKSDGTAAGTALVKDITAGLAPSRLVNVNGTLFFYADDGVTGREIWKSDGTAAGTVVVKDVLPGPQGSANSSSISRPVNANGVLYFNGSDGVNGNGLWKTDGTEAGTVLLYDQPLPSGPSSPTEITEVGSTTFFLANGQQELWKTDGTAAGAQLVKSFGAIFNVGSLENVNGTLLFSANDGVSGRELWKSDGTEAGTVMVKDIVPGSGNSVPENVANVNGIAYFSVQGGGLWKSDGTDAGTVLVKDTRPTVAFGPLFNLTAVGDTLFFTTQDDEHGYELWKSDGTASGTVMVKDIMPGGASSVPPAISDLTDLDFINANGTLYFTANDGTHGYELWKSDGTEAGTVMVKDIEAGPTAGIITPYDGALFGRSRVNVGGTLFFSAKNGQQTGYDLWKTDGTTEGTVIVSPSSNRPAFISTEFNGELYFTGAADGGFSALFKTDGTAAGTSVVKTFDATFGGIEDLVVVEDRLFLSVYTVATGGELWASDGTGAGTFLVRDILPGPAHSVPFYLTSSNGRVFFAADDGVHGRELWSASLPGVSTNASSVTVDAGQAAALAGTFLRAVSLSASVGTIIDNGDGTWSWSFTTTAPIETQVVSITATDSQGDQTSETFQLVVKIPPVNTPAELAAVVENIPPGATEVRAATTTATLDSYIETIADLPANTGGPVFDIVLNLADGDYQEPNIIDVPVGYRVIINGSSGQVVFHGNSPSLIVASGEVLVTGVTFLNATDSPTILVTGGSLVLRDSLVQETAVGNRAAIEITGGSVDLGTSADPGGNTIEARGAGALVRNLSGQFVAALGNTLEVDGTPLGSPSAVEARVHHGLDIPGLGIVGFADNGLFVAADQGAVSASAGTIVQNTGAFGAFGVDAVSLSASVGSVVLTGDGHWKWSYPTPAGVAQNQTVVVTATDSDGNVTSTSFSLVVTAAAPGVTLTGGVLTILGSETAGDVVAISRVLNNIVVVSTMSGIKSFAVSAVTEIRVDTRGGNDIVATLPNVAKPMTIDGGAGNDVLTGGGGANTIRGGAGNDLLYGADGADILLGGDGDDLLFGGQGRDLLIGGDGADTILGNADDDVLVAGTTDYDADAAALAAIMAEWNSSRSYAQRTANISGTGSGSSFASRLNSQYYFNASALQGPVTVHDDNDKDTLSGDAGRDWFFANVALDGDDDASLKDRIADLKSNEFAVDLDYLFAE